MLVISMTAMGICHIILGICFHVQENEMPKGQMNTLVDSSEIPSNMSTIEVLSYTSTLAPPPELVGDHRVGILGWLPVVTVVIFLFMGNIGYGTLIWVVTGNYSTHCLDLDLYAYDRSHFYLW